MTKLTIVAGVLALLALTMPDLALLGLLLIVPGLILVMAPTVFVYLATATAIRFVLPQPTSIAASFTALVAALGLGWLMAWPLYLLDYRKFRASIKEDVECAQPIELRGNIRLERSDLTYWKRDADKICDELCAALLLVPGVESVTLARGEKLQEVTNWRLAPKGSVSDTGLAPTNPGAIIDASPVDSDRVPTGKPSFQFKQQQRQWLAAEWNLRLGTQQTLVASDTIPEPDMTISITHRRERTEPRVQRVEVIDGDGVTLFRRSLVQHRAISAPFYIAFDACFSNSHFEIGRTRLSTGERHAELKPVTELLMHVWGLHQTPSSDASQEVKRLLVAALNTSDHTPPELAMAVPWVSGLDRHKLSDEDQTLVHRIIGDLRIPAVADALQHLYPKTAPVEYRSILVQRIIAPETAPKDRNVFAKLLTQMPAGTFAAMTEQEWQIIKDPLICEDAFPFIERLADLGPAGAEHLKSILQHTVDTIPEWRMRKPKLRALCAGFTRLGTSAEAALPLVKTLFEQQPHSKLTNSADDALQWRVAMVRMGLALEELPYPLGWDERRVARMRQSVSRQVAAYVQTQELPR